MSSKETSPPEEDTAQSTEPEQPAFGWTLYAEQMNGRFAMIGLVILLLLNLITGQDFWTWLGLR